MGSFNTTCFASMQTIASGDKCYIFPIKMESGYQPVEISLGEEKFSPSAFTSSTCYANAFWASAGRLISAQYDDYGRFEVDETDRNEFILKQIFTSDNLSEITFYKTEEGENSCHDVPFDPKEFESKTPYECLDYIWEPIQEHRVFVRNYKGKPTQFQFAVISKVAADYIFNMVNEHKDWNGNSCNIELKVQEIEQLYKDWSRDEDCGLHLFFFRLGSFFESGEMTRSFYYWYISTIIDDQKGKPEFTENTKEILRDLFYEKYVFAGLDFFNVKIMPIIYASQDYDNSIGKDYAKFVKKVSSEICKNRKDLYD